MPPLDGSVNVPTGADAALQERESNTVGALADDQARVEGGMAAAAAAAAPLGPTDDGGDDAFPGGAGAYVSSDEDEDDDDAADEIEEQLLFGRCAIASIHCPCSHSCSFSLRYLAPLFPASHLFTITSVLLPFAFVYNTCWTGVRKGNIEVKECDLCIVHRAPTLVLVG